MSVGEECPECGHPLGIDNTCRVCNWKASSILTERPSSNACADCQTPTRVPQLTIASPDPANDDALPRRSRCASCHLAYLKRRAALGPISPADFVKYKAQLEMAYQRAGVKWASVR